MQDRIIEIIFSKDDVTWQTMIYELVKVEGMDPWDVDLSAIVEKFLNMVRQLREMDFRISGKVILAAAILLKIKAIRLVNEDIGDFDRLLIATEEMSEEQFYGDIEAEQAQQGEVKPGEEFKLIPRTPQPRKRKVSVYDLVNALQKALEVKHRRVMRDIPEIRVHLPEYHVDIDVIITKLYERIENYLLAKNKPKITFSQLVPSNDRIDKVMTFVPLLHLTSQRKIDLDQKEHFGEIDIMLAINKPSDIKLPYEIEMEEQEKKIAEKKARQKPKKPSVKKEKAAKPAKEEKENTEEKTAKENADEDGYENNSAAENIDEEIAEDENPQSKNSEETKAETDPKDLF